AASVNPMTTIGLSDNRVWTDTNGDFQLQDSELGPTNNVNFGKIIPATTITDQDVREGFGSRGYSWEFTGAVQHQLLPRVAANFAYSRRSNLNPLSTDNLLVAPGDYDAFTLKAPVDPRLPNNGGYVISGLYDLNPAKRGLVDNFRTFSKNLGDEPQNIYTSYNISLNARLAAGTVIQGGVDMGRAALEGCSVVDSPQQLMQQTATGAAITTAPASWCKNTPPYRPQWKLLGSKSLPWDLRASGTFQYVPGPASQANYSFRSNEAIGLNRAFTGATTKTVQLIEPGTLYEAGFNQLDLRLTKKVRLGGAKNLDLMADLYNVFNDNGVVRLNTTYGSNWLRPTQILEGRLFKFGVQYDF